MRERKAGAAKGVPAKGTRVVRGKNRAVQVAPTGRKLFDAARKAEFLEWFSGTGNLSLSAEKADIHYRTVLRHRATCEGFGADFDAALAQSKVRIQAWLVEAKDDGRTEYDPAAHEPPNLSPEQAMQYLRDTAQREAAAAKAAAAGPGMRAGGRPYKAVDMEEVRREVVKRLVALGIRLDEEEAEEAEERRRRGEEDTPPPCFGSALTGSPEACSHARSPSPSNEGEEL